MSYRISYTNKWTGKTSEHICKNSEADARGWTEHLARDNDCKAVCEHVADGPYDYSEKVTHVVSEGHNR